MTFFCFITNLITKQTTVASLAFSISFRLLCSWQQWLPWRHFNDIITAAPHRTHMLRISLNGVRWLSFFFNVQYTVPLGLQSFALNHSAHCFPNPHWGTYRRALIEIAALSPGCLTADKPLKSALAVR